MRWKPWTKPTTAAAIDPTTPDGGDVGGGNARTARDVSFCNQPHPEIPSMGHRITRPLSSPSVASHLATRNMFFGTLGAIHSKWTGWAASQHLKKKRAPRLHHPPTAYLRIRASCQEKFRLFLHAPTSRTKTQKSHDIRPQPGRPALL